LNLFSTFDAGSEARVGFAMQKPRDLWPVFHRSSVSFALQNRKWDRCKTLILQRPLFKVSGGDKRDRTADLLNAIERLATFDGEKVREIANIKSF